MSRVRPVVLFSRGPSEHPPWRPKAEFRDRSAQHEGVAWLELDIDADPGRLVGYYYTERKTSGDIEVKKVSSKIVRE